MGRAGEEAGAGHGAAARQRVDTCPGCPGQSR